MKRMAGGLTVSQPTNVVAFFLFPLWLFHFAYALLADIVAAPHSAQILMRLVSTAVNLLLPCLIFLFVHGTALLPLILTHPQGIHHFGYAALDVGQVRAASVLPHRSRSPSSLRPSRFLQIRATG